MSKTTTKTTIVCKGLATLFKNQVIKVLAGDLAGEAGKRASKILEEHFTFTAAEMAKNFQQSYVYALTAIGSGLATPDKQRSFFKTLKASKIDNEFSAQLERDYLQPFAEQQQVTDEQWDEFRQQAVAHCQEMAILNVFQGEERAFSDAELALLLNTDEAESLTHLLLKLIQSQYRLSKAMIACLRFKDLLGYSLLFFLYERLRTDPRFQTTLSTLQQQGLMVDVREIKTLVQSANDALNQAFAENRFDEVPDLGQELTRLKQVESVTQQHYSEWLAFNRQFSHWSQLMTLRLEQILLALPQLSQQLDEIKEETGQIKSGIKQALAMLQQIMHRFDLSSQIKPRDELTHHNTASLELIKQAIELSRHIAISSPEYSQIAINLGSVVSSQGDLKQAEALFIQAYQQANDDNERALSQFNLFQLFIRQQSYDKAFTALQKAISLNPQRYALHNVHTYTLQRILGAGGMGCVFLATDLMGKQVAIKCFWEMASGSSEELFKEARLMAEVAGAYVPKPIVCGFVDEINQQRGYFVAEYISGAIDGEAWLEKYGVFDVQTGIAIGLQIAQGLQLAHEKGIYHLDIKPANILLKQLDNKKIQVKIIDFGLANIAPSLGQEMVQKSRQGLSLFAQAAFFGTLDYAPPEQQGMTRYGTPSAKSDVYSFGKTLYRLLTAENPQSFHPRRLKAVFELYDLLCDCVENDPQQRPIMKDVIQRLAKFLAPKKLKKKTESSKVALRKKTMRRDVVRIPKRPEPKPHPKPKPKITFLEPEMIQIPAGDFIMGCIETKKSVSGLKTIEQGRDDVEDGCFESEKPAHKVTLQAFLLAKYPVTFNEFDAFCVATGFAKPNDQGWGRGKRPVIHVSWGDAQHYIAWLAEVSGKTYRLPSEAEWEYAARANSNTAYPWGNKASNDYMNYDGKIGKTTPVENYPANEFGLHDMHGNVWEWVADAGQGDYQDAPTDGSVWETAQGTYRVVRGGSWLNHGRGTRSAVRLNRSPDDRDDRIGLRLALG